jgi:hypothetical protein
MGTCGNDPNLLIVAICDLVEGVQDSFCDVVHVHAPFVGMKVVDAKFY